MKTAVRKSPWVFNVLLVVISLAIGFAAAEITFRILFPEKPVEPTAFVHRISENPVLIYEPTPLTTSEAYRVMNHINSDGFRDREFPVERTPGFERIVYVGDSVIYGYAVELEDSLPKQLEFAFQQAGKKVEVLNMGVSGYDSEQILEFYRYKGEKYQPDLVLVGYSLNDSRYASWELELFRSNFQSVIKGEKLPFYRHILAYAFTHSRLLSVLDKRLKIQKKVKILRGYPMLADYIEDKYTAAKDQPGSEYRELERLIEEEAGRAGTSPSSLNYLFNGIGFRNNQPLYASHWKLSYEAFRKFSESQKGKQTKAAVVINPIIQEMEHYPLAPLHEFLRIKFEALGLEVIDLLPVIEKLSEEYPREKLTGDGVHFEPLVAKAIGDYLKQEIEARGLLK